MLSVFELCPIEKLLPMLSGRLTLDRPEKVPKLLKDEEEVSASDVSVVAAWDELDDEEDELEDAAGSALSITALLLSPSRETKAACPCTDITLIINTTIKKTLLIPAP